MRFSVIIPAHNEAQTVAAAIAAVKRQSVGDHAFEIIVIDNDSDDGTGEVAKYAGADKVIREDNRGTNIARQRGVDESDGEILVFLDADSEPFADWLERIDCKLSDSAVVAVSGPNDYGFKGCKRFLATIYTHHVFRYLDVVLYFIFRKKAGVIMAGNFAASRETIKRIGGLPPVRFYGDDASISIRIARQVGRVVFSPDLTIKSSSRRFDREGILRLTLRYAWHYFKVYFSKTL